jgi:hypothetical protein
MRPYLLFILLFLFIYLTILARASIKKYQEKFPIVTYDYSKYNKIKREKLLKAWMLIYEDYFKFAGLKAELRPGASPPPPKKPYHPLELE